MNRLWKTAALCALGLTLFALGYITHRNEWIPQGLRDAVNPREAQRPARPFGGDAFPLRTDDNNAETQEAILALGYAQGSRVAKGSSGVLQYDADAAWNGLNLYTSGHAPEATLMDMQGKTLQTWRCDIETAIPEFKRPEHIREAATKSWRRAYLYPNGDLLAVFEGIALVRIDRHSQLKWVYSRGCHHDVSVNANGEIVVLTSELREGIIDNGIAVLSSDGQEQRHVSILDCFRASPYATLLDWLPSTGDVLHVNTVKALDDTHQGVNPAFQNGTLLISALTLNSIAVVDFDSKTVPWAITGLWRAQHEPTLLPSGNILVFDNRGAGDTSRVLEIEPLTQRIVWQHPADGSAPFYSQWCGSAARLPNGNTLITETDNGRAFEVTADHRVVWEFINPNQFDEAGVRMVAALFDVVRFPHDYAASWLPKN